MDKKKIRLTRLWAGHQPGEIVEEDAPCADSMIRKGYGVEYKEPERKKKPFGRGPAAETAVVNPVAERAVVTPQTGAKDGD